MWTHVKNLKYIFCVTRRSRSDECDSLSTLLIVSTDLTDVTLVSDDTFWGLYWCYSGNWEKVIQWEKFILWEKSYWVRKSYHMRTSSQAPSYASNGLAKLWLTHSLNYSLTGVRCRATSVAKIGRYPDGSPLTPTCDLHLVWEDEHRSRSQKLWWNMD